MINKAVFLMFLVSCSQFANAENTYSCLGNSVAVNDGYYTQYYQISGRGCYAALESMFDGYMCYDSNSTLNTATGANTALFVSGGKDCYYMAENSVNGYYCINDNMVLNLKTNVNSGIPNGLNCDDFINGY